MTPTPRKELLTQTHQFRCDQIMLHGILLA